MKNNLIVAIIAGVELLIGLMTLTSLVVSFIGDFEQKPLNVFIFVFITSLISIMIGLGLFVYHPIARRVLIYFSIYIVLIKIMIFFHLLEFKGEIITFLPQGIKDTISFMYHGLIIILLNNKSVRKAFL